MWPSKGNLLVTKTLILKAPLGNARSSHFPIAVTSSSTKPVHLLSYLDYTNL
jgi:hypothetical protein